jgi:glycosyltransferase involved in cell wall biosynthesis
VGSIAQLGDATDGRPARGAREDNQLDTVDGARGAAGRTDSPSVTQFPGVRTPRVSVVIGCYNQAAYVEAAIRSVAAQSYGDFECVVIDDNSTDGTPDRVQDVLASLGDPRFRATLRRQNGGQMVTMLEGLDATSSPFVAFLDADDLWHPAFLERHVLAHLSERGVAAVSCSNLAVIDTDGIQLSGGKPNFIGSDPRDWDGRHKIREEMLDTETRVFVRRGFLSEWIWSATSALMFRRAVVEVLRPVHPERLRICADHYLARGAHMLGGTVRIERSLGCYRLHGSNGFARNRLFGDRTAFGRPPQDIVAAATEEFIQRLCSAAQELRATLPPGYVAKLLLGHAGQEGATALAESNAGARLILSAVPQRRSDTRLRSIKRRLMGWFRRGGDTTEGSG